MYWLDDNQVRFVNGMYNPFPLHKLSVEGLHLFKVQQIYLMQHFSDYL